MIKVRKFAFSFLFDLSSIKAEKEMSRHVQYPIVVDLFHMNSFTSASTNLTTLSASANGDPHFFPFSFSCHKPNTQRQHTIIKHAYAGHKLVPDI
jgi:hypothetical protein